MYTNRRLSRRDVVGRSFLNGVGLGEELPEDFSTISKTGVMVQTVVSPLTQSYDPLGISVAAKLPGVGKTIEKIGGGSPLAPLIGAPAALTLDIFTLGLMRLPGISNLIGGLFKKATHMGDCMKWWSDSNIRGMAGWIEPYSFIFEEYMRKSFPQFIRQYQIMQAGGEWGSVGIDNLLNVNNRRNRIQNNFISLVRSNPDIMMLQCAVQHAGESGYTGHTAAQVGELFDTLKEYARQQEYRFILSEVDRLMAPFRAKQQWTAIVASRKSNLLVQREGAENLTMPSNIIGVRRGALVMTPKTAQTSSRN